MEIVRNFVVMLGHSLNHAVYSSDELTTLFNNARKVGGFVISRTSFTDAASAQDGKCCSRRLSGKFHGLTVLTPEARGRESLKAGLDEMTNITSFEMYEYVLHSNNPSVFVLLLRLDAVLWKGVCTFANDVTSEYSAVNMPLRGRNVLPSDVIKGFATWLCGWHDCPEIGYLVITSTARRNACWFSKYPTPKKSTQRLYPDDHHRRVRQNSQIFTKV